MNANLMAFYHVCKYMVNSYHSLPPYISGGNVDVVGFFKNYFILTFLWAISKNVQKWGSIMNLLCPSAQFFYLWSILYPTHFSVPAFYPLLDYF